MSILIKGIDMPKRIDESLIFAICDDTAVCISTCLEYEAVEVPTPHGRLIDMDNITVNHYVDNDGKSNRPDEFIARVVIEAEVEE